MEEPNLVVVGVYGNRVEAELAKGVIENAGIPAMIKSDTVGRMREHIAWSGAGFQILVREENATAARDVLAAANDASKAPDAALEDDRNPPPSWRRFT